MKDLVIIGAGGHARAVAWLVEEINQERDSWNLIGFIDEDATRKGLVMNGYPILGSFEHLNGAITKAYAVCAVANPQLKKKLIGKGLQAGYKFVNLIHPNVRMSKHISMEEGNMICAGNIIGVNVSLGNHIIINFNCTIGHDSVIADLCTLAPAVNVAGNVAIGQGCDIGIDSTIIQGVAIGEWTVLGAGAVATKDLPPYCTAVGVPAKPIKFHR